MTGNSSAFAGSMNWDSAHKRYLMIWRKSFVLLLGFCVLAIYRIYPCIMCTFFTTFEAEKLRCALYTEPFVSEALLIFINKRNNSGSVKRGVTFQEKWLRIRF